MQRCGLRYTGRDGRKDSDVVDFITSVGDVPGDYIKGNRTHGFDAWDIHVKSSRAWKYVDHTTRLEGDVDMVVMMSMVMVMVMVSIMVQVMPASLTCRKSGTRRFCTSTWDSLETSSFFP